MVESARRFAAAAYRPLSGAIISFFAQLQVHNIDDRENESNRFVLNSIFRPQGLAHPFALAAGATVGKAALRACCSEPMRVTMALLA
jgi:hypothetical protein